MSAQNEPGRWQALLHPERELQAELDRAHRAFLDSDRKIREALRAVLPRAGRESIAAQLGLTRSQLDSYCSHGKKPKARLCAALVPLVTELLQRTELAFAVVGPRIEALARLGSALVELGEIDPRAARLVARLQRPRSRRRRSKRSADPPRAGKGSRA